MSRHEPEEDPRAATFMDVDDMELGEVYAGPDLHMGRPKRGARPGVSPAVTFRMSAALQEAVSSFSAETGLSASTIARRGVAMYMDAYRKEHPAPGDR